jgi:two-component system OmpR family response regulator
MASPELTKILMVEDDEDIRTIAEMALQHVGGFDVQLCESGQDALTAVADFGPDLIMLDVMMPGMDGPSTLAAMRARGDTAAIPVIFMTAKVQPHEVESYLALGAIGVIHKPFDPMQLSDEIRQIWQQAHA